MPCRSPLRQYHALSGSGWTFNPGKPHDEYRDLDCGVCIECRLRKARDWAIRCYHEQQMHQRSCFITLTYSDNPIALCRKDIQVFIKAMRDAGLKFSYFGCGEYGDETLRPHYHLILFGIDFSDDRYPWKRSDKGFLVYRSPTLEKFWRHGYCDIGEVTEHSATYVARYTTKKINGALADQADEDTGLRPYDRLLPDDTIIEVPKEMLFCSLKPAIGLRWFLEHGKEVYPSDKVVLNGREYPPPKYYDSLMKKYQPELWEEIVEARLANVELLTDERRESICESRQKNRDVKGALKRTAI